MFVPHIPHPGRELVLAITTNTERMNPMTKKVLIEGMSCGHCASHVKDTLGKLNGIKSVEVDLEGKFALLQLTDPVDDEQIKIAVEGAGYTVTGIQ